MSTGFQPVIDSDPGRERFLRRLKGASAARARRLTATGGLIPYTEYTLPQYHAAWHHRQVAELLEQVCDGYISRLMIFAPPRHGKSELASIRFPAFYLGHHPQRSVIGTSYALELAVTFSRACRNVIESQAHQKLFPMGFMDQGEKKWTLAAKSTEYKAISNEVGVVGDERPSYIAAGAGGPITGQGAHLLNIDDPYKNYEEANSVVIRENLWNWYISTARTRLMPGGAVVLTLTRWHEDDLAGRLLLLAKENPRADQWVVLEVAADNDAGDKAKLWSTDGSVPEKKFEAYEALWPAMYDREFLEKTKATQGPRLYAAMYDQKPQPATGNVIKRPWLNRWYVTREWADANGGVPKDGTFLRPGYEFASCVVLPEIAKMDAICQSWDLAFKDKTSSDFVAGQVWGRVGADKFLLDRVCERLDFPATRNKLRVMTQKWGPLRDHAKYIEDKANGPAIIADLRGEISGLIAVEPIGDKTARLSAASVDCEAGNVILPWPGMYLEVYDFIEQLCVFPTGVHDDDCDAFSQAMHKLKTKGDGLFELWRRQAAALGKAKAASLTDQQRADHDKREAFAVVHQLRPPMPQAKKPRTFTLACPTCGNKILGRLADGRWRCTPCGASGKDEETVQ